MQYKILCFKSLASTQDKAKEFAKKGLSNLVIVAGTQTKGRGRFKRKWHSAKGGLWMSVLLKPKDAKNLSYLTFAAAAAVVKSIKKTANLDASIKWPNDVHYKGKKLCGILTEGIFGKEDYAVVGIGVNVNQNRFPEEIKSTATSLRIIKKKIFSKKFFFENIADEFFILYNNYYNKNKLRNILKIWKKYCDTIGKNVTAASKAKKLKGEAIGVDEDCSLLLKTRDNRIIKIMEGNIKVKN